MLKSVPELKANKSSKLLLVDVKVNSSILMRLEMAGAAQSKQKCIIFIVVPWIRVVNQVSRIS